MGWSGLACLSCFSARVVGPCWIRSLDSGLRLAPSTSVFSGRLGHFCVVSIAELSAKRYKCIDHIFSAGVQLLPRVSYSRTAGAVRLAFRLHRVPSTQPLNSTDDGCDGVALSGSCSESFAPSSAEGLDYVARRSGQDPAVAWQFDGQSRCSSAGRRGRRWLG